jgi:hypothetical protein
MRFDPDGWFAAAHSGFPFFRVASLTGYGVMLTGSAPLAPHVLWKLVMVAGIVLALTASLSAIFEREVRKAVAEGRVPR